MPCGFLFKREPTTLPLMIVAPEEVMLEQRKTIAKEV